MHAFAWRCWWTLLVWTIAEWVKESQIEPHRESKPKQKILNQYLPLIISIWKRAIDVRVSIRSNKFQKGKKNERIIQVRVHFRRIVSIKGSFGSSFQSHIILDQTFFFVLLLFSTCDVHEFQPKRTVLRNTSNAREKWGRKNADRINNLFSS